ncbi:MAG TPA: P-loop NTPase [Candidatus Eisenbacteria bacterium]|nr:P-loop NTPase [Candidatus Eisenbacteria bacterium]
MRFEDSTNSGDPDRRPDEANGHGHGNGNGGGHPSERLIPADYNSGIVTVLLILEDDGQQRTTRAALHGLPGVEVVGERTELRSGLLLARQKAPRVVLLDLPDDYDEALTAAGHFKLDAPDTALFLLSNSLDPQLLLKAIRAGAQEVLKKPLDRALLQEAVERVSRSGAARSASGTRARSIVTLFTIKGGVGSSTVAANLAVALKANMGVETALADFDAQTGSSAHLLGLRAERSMSDLLRAPRIDSATLRMNLLAHSSGVNVLAQPEDLTNLEPITPAQAGEVLDALSATHDVVVVDAPHTFDEVSLEILDRSTTILVVGELSIPAIRAARRAMELLDRLHFTNVPDRVRLIVNRSTGTRGLITLDQLAEAMQMQPYHTIQNDYRRVFASVNAGRALCQEDPESPAAKDIIALAAKLSGKQAPAPQAEESIRRGLFGKKVLR